jgi:hypothetical protein
MATDARMPPGELFEFPDDWEVDISPATAGRCLFWSRRSSDALAILAGAVLAGMTVRVSHVRAAVETLRSYDIPAAKAFWLRLRDKTRSRGMDRQINVPEWVETYTPSPGSKLRLCCHKIQPRGKVTCTRSAKYKVPGAPGAYCKAHVRFACGVSRRRVARKEKRLRVAARAAEREA